MKKLVLLLSLFGFLVSCGVGEARSFADEFHEKLDAGEVDYIVENLVDEEQLEIDGEEAFAEMFELIQTWGTVKSREADSGFNSSTNNGLTEVRLGFTCDYENIGVIYEKLVLVDRGEGFKLLGIFYNQDKDKLEANWSN